MKRLLSTFLLAVWVMVVHATTYYISAAGLTGNTGTSITSTWPASKLSGAFAAGDIIKFKKGDTFTGTFTFTSSGASGNLITFDVYGTALNNPVIDGGGSTSSALYLNGCSYLAINNISVQNCSTSCEAPFNLNNCHDVTITNCYTGLGKRGMVLTFCTGNVVVTNCFFSKFADAVSGGQPAAGGGSGIQWQHCSGSGNKVTYNKFYIDGSVSTNGVGDIISLYIDNFGTGDVFPGVGSFGMEVAYNQVRGGSSATNGYAAVVGGDVGGSNQYIHDNTAINTGKVGMQVQGGTNINMSNNIIYGKVLSYTSVGLAFGNYSNLPVSSIVMGGNKINFYSASNSGIFNKWWDPTTKTYPAFQPTNWTTNTADNTADAGAYDALLADPLFNTGDWNTSTTPLAFGALVNVIIGVADYDPGAVSSSTFGITYTSDNPAVATIVSGKIHVVAVGTANITANDQFNSIPQLLTVLSSAGVIRLTGRKIHAN